MEEQPVILSPYGSAARQLGNFSLSKTRIGSGAKDEASSQMVMIPVTIISHRRSRSASCRLAAGRDACLALLAQFQLFLPL